jgi:hypothetical protein
MANRKEVEPVKKPYQPPKLERYGDIRELTHTVGKDGMFADGGHGTSMEKTS